MKCFNGFCSEGVVKVDTVSDILQMMGLRVQKTALDDIINEVDEDGEENPTGFFFLEFTNMYGSTTEENTYSLTSKRPHIKKRSWMQAL